MKKLFLIITLTITLFLNAQTSIVGLRETTRSEAPIGTYIKDTDNEFIPYLGTWKYQNGNEIFILKLEKITKYYDSSRKIYFDFIKGNYSYSLDGGNTYLVNTIQSNNGNNLPEGNSLFGSYVFMLSENFTFRDILYNKLCFVTLVFPQNNTNFLEMKLSCHTKGSINGQPIQSGFSIPNNIILIKQ